MSNISLKFGDVRQKKIKTKNHFVSHMIEHIAWRMGLEIDLVWDNENWQELGKNFGEKILKIADFYEKNASTIGMIDDGIAEVLILKNENKKNNVEIFSSKNFEINDFLNSRVEQCEKGKILLEILYGISESLNLDIKIFAVNFEDPHHLWEGIFRGVGICLYKIFVHKQKAKNNFQNSEILKNSQLGEISILKKSAQMATVRRGTAETGVEISVDFSKKIILKNEFKFLVDSSISTKNLDKLLQILAENAGFNLKVIFSAKVLSSSHVVLEDIGMVLGRALLEILKLRFENLGANGSGSSLKNDKNFRKQNPSIGISVEGRKFLRFLAEKNSFPEICQEILIGKNIFQNLRSEDLDDFLDGFCGGMNCSMAIIFRSLKNAEKIWLEIFKNLGIAICEAFEINTSRIGLPPGVKATLV